MDTTKSDGVVKEGIDGEISKLGKENSNQTKKSIKKFRKKLIKDFQKRKAQFKQRKEKRKQRKDGTCEEQRTESKDISDNKQPSDKLRDKQLSNKVRDEQPSDTVRYKQPTEKVKNKLKSKVQKDGPHKDVKRLQHGPRKDSKASKKDSNVNKKSHKGPREFRKDEYPGDAPVSKKLMSKYQRGKQMQTKGTRTFHGHVKLVQNEKKLKMAVKQAARSERLLQEEPGFLIPEDGESTTNVSQSDIVQSVDITTAQKHFNLDLPQFGPYKLQYTRNGKYLLIAGSKGHVAAMDWLTKRLLCEVNVMETVRDIRWLHQETMFAVAQKEWTYVYDNQGIELHCLKQLHEVLRLEFLPYHFLLASSNVNGYLYWLDVSVGQKVAGHSTGLGRLDVMCQNPHNAIICLGHPGGSVTMWSPNVNEPLVKMLCHGAAVRSIAVDSSGM
ncbi:WD repeat-containing protein 46-like [Saccostrea cucullata]|uniref:WD repeat-containing protein 46-like n=1 Tax=Saccostrea cuccullata TaxID=36930 RepID=UPI002ED5A293